MPVGVSFAPVARFSPDDHAVVRALVDASVAKARSQGRGAVAELFQTLSAALGASSTPATVTIECAADLDDEELGAVMQGVAARAERERLAGHAARADLFTALNEGLSTEQTRRASVLAALDRSIAWYEAHPPRA